MKKISRILFFLLVAFVLVFTTSCNKKVSEDEKYHVCVDYVDANTDLKCDNCDKLVLLHTKYVFSSEALNLEFKAKHDAENASKPEAERTEYKEVTYLGLYDSVNGILYLEGASVPTGSYVLVEKGNGLPALDLESKGIFGPYFAGWYQTDEYRNAEGNLNARLITFNDIAKDADHVIYADTMDFVEALLVAGVCILIVFGMLVLLWGLVTLLKFVAPKQKEVEAPKAAPVKQAAAPKRAISLADIKDEEMMAAALVATIDYHEETKEDVRVVSIKEIK